MLVRRHDTPSEIPFLATDWNRLAGPNPFRAWEWLGAWWETYGEGKLECYLLSVSDEAGRIVLLAPLWIDNSLARGRVVRFWGDNEVCTDHQSLLVDESAAPAAIAALANWLTAAVADGTTSPAGRSNAWDALALAAIDASDATMAFFAEQLAARGTTVEKLAGPATWIIRFGSDYEEYLQRLSKDRRREARRAFDRWFPTGLATYTVAQTPEELAAAWPIFVDLHQKRRVSLGEPGCFASDEFRAFLERAVERLAARGMLHLGVLAIEGRPAATNLTFAGGDSAYVYQMGMEPALADLDPGRTQLQALLRRAFDEGLRNVDFLRGDESYKARLRAVATPQITLQAVAPAALAQLRGTMWSAGMQMKDWIKSGLTFAGLR